MFGLLAAFILYAPTTLAFDDCTPVRLDARGGTMEYVSVRQQTGGTCYIETAAQLYDAFRFKNGADVHTNSSGLITAVEYAASKEDASLDRGGNVCDAFNFIAEHGSVNEDIYNQTYLVTGKKISDFIWSMDYLRAVFAKKIKEARAKFDREELDATITRNRMVALPDHTYVAPTYLVEDDTEQRFMEKYGNAIMNESLPLANYYARLYFPKTDAVDFNSFFKDLLVRRSENQVAFIHQLIALHFIPNYMRIRPGGFRPVCKSAEYSSRTSNEEIINDINQKFSNGRFSSPIGIGICSTLYQKGRGFNPGKRSRWGGSFENYKSCGYHAAILIGRRRNPETNRCQYLIRNSEGINNCPSRMSKDWQCEKAIGSLWIDSDKLSQSTGSLEVIQ